MLDRSHVWNIATRFPRVFSGATLHHWGLMAAHQGAYDIAERLFERAVAHYRRELAVEAIARLRVHQLMTRVRALQNPEREVEMCLEVERLLANLRRIESPEPPFERVDACSLLAHWIHRSPDDTKDERLGTEPHALAA